MRPVLALVALALVACDDRAALPEGETPDGPTDCRPLGERYALCTRLRSFDAAAATCEAWGGTLAILDEPGEADALAALADDSVRGWHWIGLTDAEEEGRFAWVDGQPLTLPAWYGDEPNDRWGSEDCVFMYSHTGTWNDYGCDRPLAALCERPAAGVPIDP
ncbi:MAG: lectin-like protein [bacterium]